MALPDTKRVGRGLIICRGGKPIVTCIVLLRALFFYDDNDTTYTTRCDVDYFLLEYKVLVHRMVTENRPVDPGSSQGSHRPISFIRIKHRTRGND